MVFVSRCGIATGYGLNIHPGTVKSIVALVVQQMTSTMSYYIALI